MNYKEYDLSKIPEKENDLVQLTGTKIVPAFIFTKSGLLRAFNKPKIMIGFEQNKDEIEQLTLS